MTVLDASALLALLFRETGHEQVAAVLDGACLSAVNLAEVLGRFARDGHDPDLLLRRLEALPLEIVPFEAGQAARTARMLPTTQAAGLSLGDRACLALAAERGVAVLTADRAWLQVDVGVAVRLLR